MGKIKERLLDYNEMVINSLHLTEEIQLNANEKTITIKDNKTFETLVSIVIPTTKSNISSDDIALYLSDKDWNIIKEYQDNDKVFIKRLEHYMKTKD